MKRIFALAILTGISLLNSASLFAWGIVGNGGNGGGSGGDGAVGAPIDGGLLAILAAAGVTYFAARKKKKNSQ